MTLERISCWADIVPLPSKWGLCTEQGLCHLILVLWAGEGERKKPRKLERKQQRALRQVASLGTHPSQMTASSIIFVSQDA